MTEDNIPKFSDIVKANGGECSCGSLKRIDGSCPTCEFEKMGRNMGANSDYDEDDANIKGWTDGYQGRLPDNPFSKDDTPSLYNEYNLGFAEGFVDRRRSIANRETGSF